jgi:alkyl sulfatase BDS1-like metallo-beta-lactamase superfamily hydrolase
MSAKVVANAFWKREAELELLSHGLRETWIFMEKKSGPYTGTTDDIMEYIDKKRSVEQYSHDCSAHCKEKGKLYFQTSKIVRVNYGIK